VLSFPMMALEGVRSSVHKGLQVKQWRGTGGCR